LAIDLNPISWITDAAGAVVDSAADAVLEGIVGAIEDGLSYVANAIAGEIAGLASVDFGSATVEQMGGVFKWIALVVAVGSIMASAAMAAVSSQGSISDTLREIPITLVLMAGWFGAMSLWVEAVTALTGVWTTEALVEGLSSRIMLDSTIALMVRGIVALLLAVFLIVFFIELLVLNHMLTFGVILGQIAIALRPVRPLRDVSGRMIRNIVSISLTPPLGVASLSLSLGRINESDSLDFSRALGGLAGLVVSVLMPLVVSRFLPLGGQSGSPGRSVVGAAAQVAGTAALVAGGAGVVAAGGGLGAFVSGGGGSAGTGPAGTNGPIGGTGLSGGTGSTGGTGSSGGTGPMDGVAQVGSSGPAGGRASRSERSGSGPPTAVASSVARLFDPDRVGGGDDR
jgi:hypothetical protein